MQTVAVTHYSDVLCVWAYIGQIRVDELRQRFGDQVVVTPRLIPVFANTTEKIGDGWRARGGYEAYAEHTRAVVARFGHVTMSPDAWSRTRPRSSLVPHAWIRAVGLVGGACEAFAWRVRVSFFRDGRDIGQGAVLAEIAAEMGLDVDALREKLENGAAWAALHADHDAVKEEGVRGSPTFVLNERRQILYGNVGYKILEANVLELLRDAGDQASWC